MPRPSINKQTIALAKKQLKMAQNLRAIRKRSSVRIASAMVHYLLILTLFPEGISMGQFAKELGISTAAATCALDQLEKLGFAKRRKKQEDNRVLIASATGKGRQLANQLAR